MLGLMSKLKKTKIDADGVERDMGFLDHLEELRWHIIRAAGAILVVAIVMMIFKEFTFGTIIFGPKKYDFFTYEFFCSLGEATCFRPPELPLETREMGEQFFIHIKASFWMGFIFAFPYVFYQLWSFIKPGLYKNEQKAARGLVFVCSMLFVVGVLFGYFIIAPFAITWLGNYSVGMEAVNKPTLASYVNYLTMFTIPCGIIFELPIVAYFLSKIGLITADFLRTYRKHAIVIIFLVSAIVTPPDVVTQILIGIPVIFLYEISIRIAQREEKKQAKALNSSS